MLKRIILKNGLRVVLVPQASSLAATVFVLVEAGSEYESKAVNGISHFLEHMVFKGTLNRPKPGLIAAELESLGAEYNAFTGQEETAYFAKAQSHKLAQVIELVADMYLNPLFNPAEIEKERGVIVEEINLYEDSPTRKIHSLYSALLYGDQPAGWDVAGEKSTIQRLRQEDFIRYRSAHYMPAATAVVIAGNFNSGKVLAQVSKLFENLPAGRKGKKAKTKERQSRPACRVKFKESDQSHLALGVRAFDLFDPRRYALEVLSEVLGGGMSSRLWIRVREELGAAYYVRSNADLAQDHGTLYFTAGVELTKTEAVIRAMLREMSRLTLEKVPATELRKAKDHMIGSLILGMETSDEQAYHYGLQEILTRVIRPLPETIRRIEEVTADEVRRVARAVFREKGLNLAVIGPYKTDARFRKILRLP